MPNILDPIRNFALVTVDTGYDDNDTSIDLSSGDGAALPDPSTEGAFNVVWWNATDYRNPTDDPNVEVVRVTAISTDTLTVTRAQEGTSASTKNTGGKTYKMMLAFTKKMRDDIETALGGAGGDVQEWSATYSGSKPATIVDEDNSVTYTPTYTNGRLASFTDGTSTWTLTYNTAGQITAITKS